VNTDRYAILLDGGFVVPKLRFKLRRFPVADDVMALCSRISADPSLRGLGLLRIYFYNAPPYTEATENPISKVKINRAETESVRAWMSLHAKLELAPDVALRMGETVCHGWKITQKALKEMDGMRPIGADDIVPHIEQKGVDLRIGLDIARLSLNRLVSTIVAVTGDSDLVPAFKFARREGLRVYLDCMKHGVRKELKVHADRLLDVAQRVPAGAIAKKAADRAPVPAAPGMPATAAGARPVPPAPEAAPKAAPVPDKPGRRPR
jgi:uncharacterized LabA/DUF88 family protein